MSAWQSDAAGASRQDNACSYWIDAQVALVELPVDRFGAKGIRRALAQLSAFGIDPANHVLLLKNRTGAYIAVSAAPNGTPSLRPLGRISFAHARERALQTAAASIHDNRCGGPAARRALRMDEELESVPTA